MISKLKTALKWTAIVAAVLLVFGWIFWQDALVWTLRRPSLEPFAGIAFALLGGADHPHERVVLRLARMLRPPTSKYGSDYSNAALLTTLGRMGPAAAAALPAIRALPKTQGGRAEALERLGEPDPADTAQLAFARVHRKSRLPIRRGWLGEMSHVGKPLTAIIRDEAEWRLLWRMHAGAGPEPPKVDFPRENVLAFFPGLDFSVVGLHFDDFTQYASSATAVFGYANSDMMMSWPSSTFVIAVVDPPKGGLTVMAHHGWFMGDGPVDEVVARFPAK